MLRRAFRFRILTLLLTVAVFGVGLSIYLHFARAHEKTIENHYKTYLYARQAIELQRPKVDAAWMRSYEMGSYKAWSADLKMDRATLVNARQLWMRSMHHARLRDHYQRVELDWTSAFAIVGRQELAALPDSDEDLRQWWRKNVENHLLENELTKPFLYGGGKWFRFDVGIVNNESYANAKRFFDLREIVGDKR